MTHGQRPRECEVSRYRHGGDPPAHKVHDHTFSLLQGLSAEFIFNRSFITRSIVPRDSSGGITLTLARPGVVLLASVPGLTFSADETL